MDKSYNKLVRDKIPEIIIQNGEEPIIEILNNEEYKKQLDKKLLEEIKEYLKDDSVEEIADILEVIMAILNYRKIEFNDVQKIMDEKRKKRGGFKEKIFLKNVISKKNKE